MTFAVIYRTRTHGGIKARILKKSSLKPVFLHKKYVAFLKLRSPSLCQQLDWLSHPLHHHTKQTIAPSKRLKSRMHDSTRLLKRVLLSPWGFPHQSQHNRNSQLLYIGWPLEVGVDLVANTENSRRSFFSQDKCPAVLYWPVDFTCCYCYAISYKLVVILTDFPLVCFLLVPNL